MTRNNLRDHLTWLLADAAYNKPVAPQLPPARDQLTDLTPPDSVSASTIQARLEALSTNSVTSHICRPPPRPVQSINAHACAKPGSSIHGLEVDVGGTETMGRPVSSTKSGRPGLLLKHEPLLTPTPTTASSTSHSLTREYAALLSARKKSTPQAPAPGVRSAHKLMTPGASVPPSSARYETVDLTGGAVHSSPGSPTAGFGEPVQLWTEDHAARPQPLYPNLPTTHDFVSDSQASIRTVIRDPPPATPRRGKKRKSNDPTNHPPSTFLDDDFPDMDDFLSEDDIMRSRIKHSASLSPNKKKPKIKASQTPSKRRIPSSDDEMDDNMVPRSSPVANSGRRLGSVRRSKTSPQKAMARIKESPTILRSGHGLSALKTTVPAVEDTSRPAASLSSNNGGLESRIIQDSDDEFLTPPSRHAVDADDIGHILESTKKPQDQDSEMEEVPTPSKTRKQSQIRSPRVSRPNSIPTISNRAQNSAPEIIPAETGEADDILELFLADSAAIDKQRELLSQKVKDNTVAYRQALRSKDTDARNELKTEKEQLTQQQKALESVRSEHQEYKDFLAKMDALLDRISNGYEQDLNTDEDEARLEEMHELEQAHKDRLRQRLDAAGINDPDLFAPGEPVSIHQSQELVRSTLDPSAARAAKNATGNSQVILQTQVPSRAQFPPLSPYPLSRQAAAPVSVDYCDVDDIPDDDELNFLESEYGQPPQRVSPANMLPRQQNQRYDNGQYEQRPPQSVSRSKTPSRATTSRNVDYLSDYSDDLDESMSYLAQNAELGQSNSFGRSNAVVRPPLTETSGNPTSRSMSAQPKSSKKAQSSSTKPSFPPEMMKFSWSSEVKRALKDRFRMSGFRHNQLEAINATLGGKDAFVLMPTGGGKSLCYQLPAVVSSGKTQGITVVVSPLLSLMQDQVEHLEKLNIRALSFNGDTPQAERSHIMSAFKESHPELIIQLLYVTPEMINKSTAFLDGLTRLYNKQKLARLVIDEAHCVSQWGHDFRPDYKALGNFRRNFPTVPVMALTATATQNVIMDVKHNLGIDKCPTFTQSFNRSNLYYEVRRKEKDNITTIANLINEKFQGQAGIVYTLSRKSTEKIAEKLRDQGISAHHYHASVEKDEKMQIQRDWQKGKIKVVVATIAFGMGIDKPDVRYVIHQSVPKSLEGYYQETGRAGRDGKPSECYLYFGFQDLAQLRKMIADGDGSYQQKERQRNMLNVVASFCDNQTDCRRVEVLRYFGEKFDKAECEKNCDNCRNDDSFEATDYSEIAIAALEVIRIQERQTLTQCTDFLTTKKKANEYNAEALDFHGIAKGMPKYEIHRILDKLAAEEALIEENVVNKKAGFAVQYFQIGPRAPLFLNGQRTLALTTRVKRNGLQASGTASRGKKRAGKAAASENFPSTIVSSPTGRAAKPKRRQTVISFDSDDEFEAAANSYENDGFVVDDEVSDDDFEEMVPPSKRTKSRQTTLGPPIARDARFDDLSELQKDLVSGFVLEASTYEEKLRNKKGLRRPLFREQDFREMAIRLTVSLDEMRRIPGIDAEKVNKHGDKFIPLVRQFQEQSRELIGPNRGGPASAGPSGGGGGDFIDLISDDDGMFDDDDMDDDVEGEISHHFPTANENAAIQAFDNRLKQIQTEQANKPAKSPKGGSKSQKGSFRGGKKAYSRRSSGSSSWAKGPRSSGVAKKRGGASGAKRASSGSSRPFSGQGGIGPSRSGGGGGTSGIGLMRY